MPITITPQTEGGIVGPGLPLHLQSDFIGPLGSNALWNITFTTIPSEFLILSSSLNLNQNPVVWSPWEFQSNVTNQSEQNGVAEGSSVDVNAKLFANGVPGGITDTGALNAPIAYSPGIAQALLAIREQLQSGTLTAPQIAQLDAIDTRTSTVLGDTPLQITTPTGAQAFSLANLFSGRTLDTLTLTEVTAGPQSTPATSDVAGWLFGVIVRITSVPAGATPMTPDQDWYPFDLAVLRVFRGTDMEERFGIHNTSFMHPFHGLYSGVLLNETLLFGNPPATSIEVDFAPGAAGQVFLMKFP